MNPNWNPWATGQGRRFRWVDEDGGPEFGQVWYNQEADCIFVREVRHDFGNHRCQVIEDQKQLKNCICLGDL